MKFRPHHNNHGRQQIKSGSRARQTERFAKRLGIPFMHKFAKNVHNDTDNEREVISTFGDRAIVQHDDKEEWIECPADDPRRGIRIDGKTYRFLKRL